jgi:CheY-like chemotaxis protein/anti-sigma regulatory factor (Ser/Thr protein kinase)
MPRILVVDDNPIDQNIAAACVAEQGLEAIHADNGLEALDMIEREKPDYILTDLQMPEMDGLTLVKKVKERFATIPIILMTGYGSEQIAVEALRAGAASYVPKENLRQGLMESLRIVRDAVAANRGRQQVRHLLRQSETSFVLAYEPEAPQALVSFVQDALGQFNISDDMMSLQISTALTEALRNAIDHGNLELDSKLREGDDNSYRDLGDERAKQPPYCDRRVHFHTRMTPSSAEYIIRDEGPGFDPAKLPDPTDPENLLRASGRGVMLIRTFMDEVTFNETGNEIRMVKHLTN